MAKRLPRGTRVNPVGIHWVVEREVKERFDAIAAHADMSSAVLFEQMVEHLELTSQGVPPWVPPRDRDGELPIDSA